MLTHVRISVPDRPGMLAQVTAALADIGADIKNIAVLERETGRAIDDIYFAWPGNREHDAVTERLTAIRGVSVLGVRPSRQVPGAFPDLDLLSQVLATASRGLDTLVDMAALAFGADWAASVTYAEEGPRVIYSSGAMSGDVVAPESPVIRPTAFDQDGVQLAVAPLDPFGALLVCGRASAPSFHRVELERIRRVTELALGLLRADVASAVT